MALKPTESKFIALPIGISSGYPNRVVNGGEVYVPKKRG